MNNSDWVNAVVRVIDLDTPIGGTLGCVIIIAFLLAVLGAIVAPFIALSKFADDWNEGKRFSRATCTDFLHSWAMFLPIFYLQSHRNGNTNIRSAVIIYIMLYICWILGITGLWALNIINSSFMLHQPGDQRFGEVFTTSFAMFTILFTGLYSIAHSWFKHRIERREAIRNGKQYRHQFYLTPFVIATVWLWLGALDNFAVYGTPVFNLAWPLVGWSVIWVIWSLTHLLRRRARLQTLMNAAGRR